MRYAIVEFGKVANIVEADEDFARQNGWVNVDALSVGIGYVLVNGEFVEPAPVPEPIPKVVTIRQAKLALNAAGLLDDIDAAIATADRSIRIEWEYATEVKRDWPTLLAMQPLLGLTDEQIDDLFKLAATL